MENARHRERRNPGGLEMSPRRFAGYTGAERRPHRPRISAIFLRLSGLVSRRESAWFHGSMFDFARLLLSSTLVASLAVGAPVDLKQSDDAGKQKPATPEDKGDKVESQEAAPVVTEHTVALPGEKTLSYKAIAGYLLIRDTKQESQPEKDSGKEKLQDQLGPSKGKPKAQVFFVAYLLNGVADAATRPVTFAFNGGPGSASCLW